MINKEDLKELSKVSFKELERNSLIDISNVYINNDLNVELKIRDFIEQIKNPYCFLCGDTAVKIEFSETGKPLDEVIAEHFIDTK